MKIRKYAIWLFNSIAFKLLSLILFIIIPLALLLIYNNNLSRDILLEQVKSTHQNMLQSYISQMDTLLNSARTYVVNLSSFEGDPMTIANTQDESRIQYAKARIFQELAKELPTNHLITGYFLYVIKPDADPVYISRTSESRNAPLYNHLEDYIAGCIEKEAPDSEWHLHTFNGQECLLLIAGGMDGIYSGAFVSLQDESEHIKSDNQIVFLSEDTAAEYSGSLSSNMILVSCASETSDLVLAEVFSRDAILSTLPFMQKYTLLVTTFLILMIVLLIVLLQHIATKPLLLLAATMFRIRQGDIEYRAPKKHLSTEISIVYNTFNSMMEDIRNLKIDIYEEQLKNQKVQLSNLQMQIKPHFLINSLNSVYNLIETRQYPIALKMIQHAIAYFRYMIQADENLIPLQVEIDHVRAYLEIQSIRYHNRCTCSIQIDPMISDMLIPPVLIQNCVENSLKYAFSMTEPLNISITVSSFEQDYFPYGKISISDTGAGYPPDQLDGLNAGEAIQKEDGAHIGIQNTIARLKLLFGEKAAWKFYNDNGAVAEFTLPATFSGGEES